MQQRYLCDPKKNTKCNKQNCAHNPMAKNGACLHTIHKECAAEPLATKDAAKENLEKKENERKQQAQLK